MAASTSCLSWPVKVLSQALEGLDKAIDDLEDEITSAHAQNEMTRLLYKVPGIGKIISSVIAASVPDPSVFKSGRDFAAWLGLTPRQNSSGGKQTLGAITKQGNRYIRKLLVLGATSLLNVMGKRKGALRDWIVGLLAKKPARLVTVALANKLARPDPLGDDEGRRKLPHRDVRKGIRKPPVAARSVHKGDLQVRVWQAQRDVMNDTVATEYQEQPAKKHERKLASMIGIPVVGLVWGSFRQVKSQGITRPLFLTKAVGAFSVTRRARGLR